MQKSFLLLVSLVSISSYAAEIPNLEELQKQIKKYQLLSSVFLASGVVLTVANMEVVSDPLSGVPYFSKYFELGYVLTAVSALSFIKYLSLTKKLLMQEITQDERERQFQISRQVQEQQMRQRRVQTQQRRQFEPYTCSLTRSNNAQQ